MISVIIYGRGRTPEYKTLKSAAADVYSNEDVWMWPGEFKAICTGLKIDETTLEDEHLEVRPRSGMTMKGIVAHLGTIDPDYKGEIKVILENRTGEKYLVQKGDRIAQIMMCTHRKIYGAIQCYDERTGGFGSTGEK